MMTEDMKFLFELASFVLVLIVHAVAFTKFIFEKIDSKMDAERSDRKTMETAMKQELDNIRETHVRRDDFHRHVDFMEKQFANMTSMITGLSVNMNSRFDSFVALLTVRKDNV